MRLYALQGLVSRELLTYGGKVLTHHDRGELEFLFIDGVRVVPLPPSIPEEQCLPIALHPDLGGLTWPLRRSDFHVPNRPRQPLARP